ncbi:hypothetical protein [Nostoc sp. FACHB-888]|uniref:hypothetical protein n=1 Tax=Nostoc sp. FACHB-888 TaxID=2692842 RepID=UPI00168A2ED4|nr:hypothetical protein [Nostoc sp. FACHB-888]MBD2248782.1 hypothetical protein [Nostoc sp. FACHB-888]
MTNKNTANEEMQALEDEELDDSQASAVTGGLGAEAESSINDREISTFEILVTPIEPPIESNPLLRNKAEGRRQKAEGKRI